MPYIETALRLNPFPPSWYFVVLGVTFRFLGRNVEAIAAYKKAISIEPGSLIAHVVLTIAYVLDGRDMEARVEAEEVLRIDPKFSVERLREEPNIHESSVRRCQYCRSTQGRAEVRQVSQPRLVKFRRYLRLQYQLSRI